MIGITILGATGSIGINTLDVVARHPDRFRVVALTANTEVDRLFDQCLTYRPRYAAMADEAAAQQLHRRLRAAGAAVEVVGGVAGLEQVARLDETGYVMAGIVGAAGLLPTLAAARAGKRVLLANKEALVMSGAIFMNEVRRGGAELLPIDSEHNAVFQCLPAQDSRAAAGVRRIWLTASGGPFRTRPLTELETVTPAEACAHPNWVMGRKISVDSATMMNKGLEVIEACWLFDTTPDRVQVVIHPQSIVHSLVEYADGSVLAQLGSPDMRTPIAHALAWPDRIEAGVKPLDLFDVARLDFEAPDPTRFPCLKLACLALEKGGTATTILNAANEVAVQSFLDGRLTFTAIPDVIERTLNGVPGRCADDLNIILEDDTAARRYASSIVTGHRQVAV